MSEIDDAMRIVLAMLPTGGTTITSAEVREKATAVVGMLHGTGQAIDLDELIRHLESRVTIWQDGAVSLVDNKDHEEWLSHAKSEIAWNRWDRYQRYLEDVVLLPPQVVWRTDEVTGSILSKLEDPKRDGPWDRRGLVVGQVQSGKTNNYTGLICKAADAGYKLVLVLAGVHNSLRAQTQLRLDEGFLGFDTQYQHRLDDAGSHFVGVGIVPGFPKLHTGSLTTSSERGDFNKGIASKLLLPIGDYPVLLVVKKNTSVLKNIYEWVKQMHGDPVPGSTDPDKRSIRGIPLLLIDDEADNASIDTAKNDPEVDPSTINRSIRQLLALFEQSAYVGYTATPFANLYSDAYGDHDDYSKDLFPSSFIESLRPPSSYFGPERVFGIGENFPEPLPIQRDAEDAHSWIPPKHDKNLKPSSKLPESLKGAIGSFVLACAARRARGEATAHNSMLIHVTRFQLVQEEVADLVRQHLHKMRRRVKYDGSTEGLDSVMTAFKHQWISEFEPVTAQFDPGDAPRMSWEQIEPHVRPALEKIELRIINGAAKDALEYYENSTNGLSVIAVGGDKLSRGLTLEGLTVSYYLRASKMYDTLMQMGRWFGYRPGYEDLCRLYTTEELRTWYREITIATEELRHDLEEMAALGATPMQYGLRVRKSPSGLAVTAANRMRSAQTMRLSFSGHSSETVLFKTTHSALAGNFQALERMIASLGSGAKPVDGGAGNRMWNNVDGRVICDTFLDSYVSDPMAWRVQPNLIADYIRKCVDEDELKKFTVVLISNSNASETESVAGFDVGLTKRSMLGANDEDERARRTTELSGHSRFSIRRLLSPSDEALGLSKSQGELALARTIEAFKAKPESRKAAPTSPGGAQIRGVRDPSNGLLLLYLVDNAPFTQEIEMSMVGFGFSFPVSENSIEVEYAANMVWTRQQLVDAGLEDPS